MRSGREEAVLSCLPGALALSFGMLGCDYHCAYCQNWFTSQTLRDPNSTASPRDLSARDLVELAGRHQARIVASTYNEPLITSEWAVEVFREARRQGLKTAYISNGNGTPEVIDYLQPWVDLYKVDLKSFRDRNYRKLGGRSTGAGHYSAPSSEGLLAGSCDFDYPWLQ